MSLVQDIFDYFIANPGIFAVLFLLYVFIYGLSILLSARKPGINPFRKDWKREAAPVVNDKKIRDKTLKQAFHVSRIPEKLDAIVIGSGMGGLAVANILAKTGQRVLVLEQHDQAGGCCHSFEDKGFEFDPGIHYIGQMQREDHVDKILVDQLSEGQVTWESLEDEYDVVAVGEPGKQKLYPMKTGMKRYKENLIKYFPEEEAGIEKFFSYVMQMRGSVMYAMMLKFLPRRWAKLLISTGIIHLFTSVFKLSQRSVQSVLEEVTENKTLRVLLCYSCGDYGTPPKEASLQIHAGLIGHFMSGASYPRGGASEFAFHIIPGIERPGGRVLVRAPVTRILCNGKGRAVGVHVRDTDIFAPVIISDAGAVNTFKKLLPKEVASKSEIYSLLSAKKVRSGMACMSLFVGLSGSAAENGLKKQNIWAYTIDDVQEAMSANLFSRNLEDVVSDDIPLLFISFPSAKDPTFDERHPGKSTCTVITMARWDWFSKWADERIMKRGTEYEAMKNQFGQRMWEQTLTLYPQLRDKVEYFDVGTPVSNAYYLNSPVGEIYGLDHTAERFGSADVTMKLRPRTDVKGLYLTGQDIVSCGFAGALFGGVMCGSELLNRNLYKDLLKLRPKKAKKTN